MANKPLWDFNKKAKKGEKVQFLIDNAVSKTSMLGRPEKFTDSPRGVSNLQKLKPNELDELLKTYNIDVEEGGVGNCYRYYNDGLSKRMDIYFNKLNKFIKSLKMDNILYYEDIQFLFSQYDTWNLYAVKSKPSYMKKDLIKDYEEIYGNFKKKYEDFISVVIGGKINAFTLKEIDEYYEISTDFLKKVIALIKSNKDGILDFYENLFIPFDYKKYPDRFTEAAIIHGKDKWEEKRKQLKKEFMTRNENIIPRFDEFVDS